MVFFSSILIIAILYYLQSDGLIFVVIVAVCGELLNLFMTQTTGKAAEKKTALKYAKVVQRYKSKIAKQKKTIKDLQEIQEKSIGKVQAANRKVKEYEKKLGLPQSLSSDALPEKEKTGKKPANSIDRTGDFNDLPPGSNRKELPS